MEASSKFAVLGGVSTLLGVYTLSQGGNVRIWLGLIQTALGIVCAFRAWRLNRIA